MQRRPNKDFPGVPTVRPDDGFPVSLLGKVVLSRSTAGHDIRRRPLVYQREKGKIQDGTIDYYRGALSLDPRLQKVKRMGEIVGFSETKTPSVPLNRGRKLKSVSNGVPQPP